MGAPNIFSFYLWTEIILNEKHSHSVLDEYINDYYNISRTQMSLGEDSPVHCPV